MQSPMATHSMKKVKRLSNSRKKRFLNWCRGGSLVQNTKAHIQCSRKWLRLILKPTQALEYTHKMYPQQHILIIYKLSKIAFIVFSNIWKRGKSLGGILLFARAILLLDRFDIPLLCVAYKSNLVQNLSHLWHNWLWDTWFLYKFKPSQS